MQKHIEILGWNVTDKITGAKGVAMSVSFGLSGCIQVLVSPKADVNGNRSKDSSWYDIPRLKKTGKSPIMDAPDYNICYVLDGREGLENIELLGKKVVDKMSGAKGVITSISFDLSGCIQGTITSQSGKTPELSFWYDIKQFKVISKIPIVEPPNYMGIGHVAEGKNGSVDKPQFIRQLSPRRN